MNRWINIALALMACLGAVFTIGEISPYQRLSNQHRTLAVETGFLNLSDITKVHVVALPSDDSLHFRWRIYLPQNQTIHWKRSSEEAVRASTGPMDFIVQVRLRNSDSGYVSLFEDMESFASVLPLGGKPLATFLHDRWDEIETVQLGADGPTAIETSDVATLLQLRMPQVMADEAKMLISDRYNSRYIPVLYKVEIRSEQAGQIENRKSSVSEVSDR